VLEGATNLCSLDEVGDDGGLVLLHWLSSNFSAHQLRQLDKIFSKVIHFTCVYHTMSSFSHFLTAAGTLKHWAPGGRESHLSTQDFATPEAARHNSKAP